MERNFNVPVKAGWNIEFKVGVNHWRGGHNVTAKLFRGNTPLWRGKAVVEFRLYDYGISGVNARKNMHDAIDALCVDGAFTVPEAWRTPAPKELGEIITVVRDAFNRIIFDYYGFSDWDAILKAAQAEEDAEEAAKKVFQEWEGNKYFPNTGILIGSNGAEINLQICGINWAIERVLKAEIASTPLEAYKLLSELGCSAVEGYSSETAMASWSEYDPNYVDDGDGLSSTSRARRGE